MKRLLSCLVACAALAGCATSSPDIIRRGEASRMASVIDGTVVSVRPVVVDGSQSGVGAVAGGVVGGIAGSSVGGKRERVAIGVLGAVGGALAGNAIERATTREDALEIVVQLRSGERRSIVQARGSESFFPGERVVIVMNGDKVRVQRQ